MKLYMALNEAGTHGDIGLHARVAALSAKERGGLNVHLLYCGDHNQETKWLQDHGVTIIDSQIPYIDLINRLTEEGRYWTGSVGHWLRTNVCLEEKTEEFILYTDVDVLFTERPDIRQRPNFFCAAPEFKPDAWNYFNAGVMIANVPALRSTYDAFEIYLRENIQKSTYNFHDQIAYNTFYQNRWDRLPVTLNWKPYWGVNEEASIIHFHGPKIHAINLITKGEWDWNTNYGKQLGSIFSAHASSYEFYYRKILEICIDLPPESRDRIASICDQIAAYKGGGPDPRTDLSFMNFKMFPD